MSAHHQSGKNFHVLRWCLDRPNHWIHKPTSTFQSLSECAFDASGDGQFASGSTVNFSLQLQRRRYRLNPAFLAKVEQSSAVFWRDLKKPADQQVKTSRVYLDLEEQTVQASAILVIDDRIAPFTASDSDLAYKGRTTGGRGPIASTEIFGESLLDRTVKRLRNAGIESVSVVAGPGVGPNLPKLRASFRRIVTERSYERWPTAQQEVIRQSAQGVRTVLMIGVNAYVEWDVRHFLDFHRSTGVPLTQLHNAQGPLDLWAVESEWFGTAAIGCTLPFRYGEFPGLPVPCPIDGYVNRLASAGDLRRLVQDGFLCRCEVRPGGGEIKPGIWVEDGALVHRLARLVAPVYLGSWTNIGASAVVTRFSNIEHHSNVGDGTIVDASSVLPFTELASGLEISRSVVEGNTLVDVRRNLALCIRDPKLIRDTAPVTRWGAPSREAGRENGTLGFACSSFFYRAAGRLSEVLFGD